MPIQAVAMSQTWVEGVYIPLLLDQLEFLTKFYLFMYCLAQVVDDSRTMFGASFDFSQY
jgi:hypothetical protein